MSNSTSNLDLISASQSSKEVTANALFDAMSVTAIYGRRASTTSGLTWGYYGGTLNVGGTPTQIANGTVALTASSTNYVEATTSGVVSTNTSSFTGGRLPLYTVITGGSSVSSYTDQRHGGTSAGLTGGPGTVTSVAMTVPSGFSVSGSPITASGTLAVTISNAANARTALGVAINSDVQAYDAELAALAGLSSAADKIPYFTGSGTAGLLTRDIDGALTANSDTVLATQKAVKTYVDSMVTGGASDVMIFKGVIDCSANPNYPAADAGNLYKISVSGKIGGASGVSVEAGDTVYCITDVTSAGTQASVGANWTISQLNIDGAVVGPASVTDGNIAVFDGTTGKLIKEQTVSQIRTLLSLVIGTDVQAYDAELAALAGLTSAADKVPYFTGSGTAGLLTRDVDGTLAANSDTVLATQKAVKTYVDSTVTGGASDVMIFKGVIDCSANPNYPAADAGNLYKISVSGKIGGASGTNVEAGDTVYCITDATSAGTQAGVGANWVVSQVNIDGAVIGPSSVTTGNIAVFDGTTGKLIKEQTVSQIRTLLSLVIGTDVQAYDAELAALAGLTSASNKIPYFTGSGTAALLTLDTDGTLAANSDTVVASQKAVKTYVDAAVSGSSVASITGTSGATGGNATATGGASTTSGNAAGAVLVTGGAQTSGNAGAGGAVTILGGTNTATGANSGGLGGAVSMQGGTGSATSTPTNGGTATVKGGTGGSGTSTGGAVTVQGGTAGNTSGASAGGAVSVKGGQSGNLAGGAVTVSGGDSGTGTGGSATIGGGTPTAGDGGPVSLIGSNGVGTNKVGGNVSATAGTSTNGQAGGTSTITGGTGGPTNGVGGVSSVVGGTGQGSGAGGVGKVQGGTAGSTGTGGDATVQGGTPIAGNGGAANVNGAAGVGTNKTGGQVNLSPGAPTGSGDRGNVNVVNGGALATTSTGGFFCIPTCAGVPTGTPANVASGAVPMIYDTTNNNLYIYNGAWKKTTSFS